jgi:hypothetical protein
MNSFTQFNNGYSLPISNTCFSCVLLPATNTQFTVPIGPVTTGSSGETLNKFIVQLKYSQDSANDKSDVWMAVNETASVTASNAFVSTDSVLNPENRTVKAGDVLNFITTSTGALVSIELFAI